MHFLVHSVLYDASLQANNIMHMLIRCLMPLTSIHKLLTYTAGGPVRPMPWSSYQAPRTMCACVVIAWSHTVRGIDTPHCMLETLVQYCRAPTTVVPKNKRARKSQSIGIY